MLPRGQDAIEVLRLLMKPHKRIPHMDSNFEIASQLCNKLYGEMPIDTIVYIYGNQEGGLHEETWGPACRMRKPWALTSRFLGKAVHLPPITRHEGNVPADFVCRNIVLSVRACYGGNIFQAIAPRLGHPWQAMLE